MMKQSDHEYTGIAVDIFMAITRELLKAGINADFQFIDADAYGSKVNGMWNGVFGELQRNVSIGENVLRKN